MLTAISPIDGRYAGKTKALQDYFSEFALIKYRVFVEVEYFKALVNIPLPQLKAVDDRHLAALDTIVQNFNLADAESIKATERITNHDVKAVEYFLKDKFDTIGLGPVKEFIHFALTSQDINNTANPLMAKLAFEQVYEPALSGIIDHLEQLGMEWIDIPMLARTHGQPASPTRLGKEILVFVERLKMQLVLLSGVPYEAKFGGATGNYNAHHVAYPNIAWLEFGDNFVEKHLGLERSLFTTQIAHYDNEAALYQGMKRINTILIDLCRDIWTYISMEYFKQKVVKGEVGSSAMPHKVNPIDFENAEGNLGLANAIFGHLADKLPISRMQRDLTDSTVLRNVGVPFGHTIIAFQSIQKGLGKLLLNKAKFLEDLDNNWMVVAEGIQNILRREGYPEPYEALKELTRGKATINKRQIHRFINGLAVSRAVKAELKQIRPDNYLGV
ncbi:MAG: adenylosuccinate lyase [Bacteroidota bacterium]